MIPQALCASTRLAEMYGVILIVISKDWRKESIEGKASLYIAFSVSAIILVETVIVSKQSEP